MIPLETNGRAVRRLPALAGAAALALLAMTGGALAGACPADKVVPAGKGAKADVTQPKGVADNVLATIDLGKEISGLDNRTLRIRELVIQPGGEVPWHSHSDRPALIYILEGEVLEYSSFCAVPIIHKAGEVAVESGGLAHWWRNESKGVVRLTSSDILHADPMSMANRMK